MKKDITDKTPYNLDEDGGVQKKKKISPEEYRRARNKIDDYIIKSLKNYNKS